MGKEMERVGNGLRGRTIRTLTIDGRIYQERLVNCGKKTCKCQGGALHGPYWYWEFWSGGRRVLKYIGKRLIVEVELPGMPLESNTSVLPSWHGLNDGDTGPRR